MTLTLLVVERGMRHDERGPARAEKEPGVCRLDSFHGSVTAQLVLFYVCRSDGSVELLCCAAWSECRAASRDTAFHIPNEFTPKIVQTARWHHRHRHRSEPRLLPPSFNKGTIRVSFSLDTYIHTYLVYIHCRT